MMSRSPPPDVSGAVDWYLTVQCKADGLSAATINEGYGYPLRRILVPFCEQEGIELVEELNPDVVTRLAAQLAERTTAQGKPLSPASRRSYLKGVQQFLSWAEKRGFGSVDASEMPLPRRRRIRRAVLTRQEMLALEDAAPTERNKLIIRFMSDTGTREGGVCAIRCGGLVVKEGGQAVLADGPGAEATEFLGRDRYARGERAHEGLRTGYSEITAKTTSGPITLERPKLDQGPGVAGDRRLRARPLGPRPGGHPGGGVGRAGGAFPSPR
jgi:hypothetical protein